MLHLKELTPLTGYVRGGCTSIGMKKHFPTVIDASAQQFEKVYVSAGRIGAQLTLAPEDLRKAADATIAEVIHAMKVYKKRNSIRQNARFSTDSKRKSCIFHVSVIK